MRIRSLAVLLALAVSSAAAAKSSPLALEITLDLTPPAARRLVSTGEGIVIDAYWYGTPSTAHRREADEVGNLLLGRERHVVGPRVRSIALTAGNVDRRRVGWLADRIVRLNVNVYSARRRYRDNILDCEAFDDRLAKAVPRLRLRCSLLRAP